MGRRGAGEGRVAGGREAVLREIREEEVVELAKERCYAGNDGSRLAAAGIPSYRYGPGDGITDPAMRYHIGRDQFISISDMVTVTRVLGLTALDICA